jgi:hypothetical protein
VTVAAETTRNPAVFYARIGFFVVALAAGISGAALLVFPSGTSEFFSWALGPPPLAALVGGFYLASAVVFAVAVRLPPDQVRSLLAASLALTLPTLVATPLHLGVFDFGRWQAWGWMALFITAPLFWGGLLGALRGTETVASDRERSGAALGLAGALTGLAILAWVEPGAASVLVPFELAGLGGRFLAAWLAFLAVMAAWYAVLPERRFLPSLALVAYPAAGVIAGLRTFSDLGPGRVAYLSALAVMASAFVRPALRARAS